MTQNDMNAKEYLHYTLDFNPPMDLDIAERNLKEARQILNRLNIVFLMGSGSCLGATRNGAFMPWDDDIDLVTVLGVNGLTEDAVDIVVDAFEQQGYVIESIDGNHSKTLMTMKDGVRLSVEFLRIEDDNVYAYPGIKIPAAMFVNPKEIIFLDEKFFVPNPPEEYLRIKYGEEWMIPKRAGQYEKDVVQKIEPVALTGEPCTLRVLNDEDAPVHNATVVLVGGGISYTDEKGYADVILPKSDWYALTINFPGHENVLYMESLEPGQTYVYKTDAIAKATEAADGDVGTLGNLLSIE